MADWHKTDQLNKKCDPDSYVLQYGPLVFGFNKRVKKLVLIHEETNKRFELFYDTNDEFPPSELRDLLKLDFREIYKH